MIVAWPTRARNAPRLAWWLPPRQCSRLFLSGAPRPSSSTIWAPPLLCRRDCRTLRRKNRSVVHPGHHVPGVCRTFGLHRELQHVRARRRLPRGQRSHGQHPGQILGLSPHVRLHPHRTHQRRIRGIVFDGPTERNPSLHTLERHSAGERDGRVLRRVGDPVFLVGKHQRASRNRAKKPCASCM